MANLARFTVVVCLVLWALSAQATPLLEVEVPDGDAARLLFAEGFDVLSIQPPLAEVLAWPGDSERLSALGYSFRVIHEDLEAFYASRLDNTLDDMGGYPTWSEIWEWYQDMLQNYPGLISIADTAGFSLGNRPIWAFKISDNPNDDEDEPELFFNAAIHAREVITPVILMSFTEYLCENYSSDAEVADLVNNREIWMMPVINPDGYVHNEASHPNGGGMWRKNRRSINNEVVGVDLNRNWPFMWANDDLGSSPNPSSQTYRGESAGSEPETQAIINFINDHEFKLIINYHSYSNLILYPFGYDITVYPEDWLTYQAIVDSMNANLGWPHGRAPDVMYEVNGNATDWQEGACDYNTFAYTVEVGGQMDGFWPSAESAEALVADQMDVMLSVTRMTENIDAMAPPLWPEVTVPDTARNDFALYLHNRDSLSFNAPYTFDVVELSYPGNVDHVDTTSLIDLWEREGFFITDERYYSAPTAHASGFGPYMNNTLTSLDRIPVTAGDTIRFKCIYDVVENWEYVYVQVSTNGESWESLEGNITTNDNSNGQNLGNGITGTIHEWVEGIFPIDDYIGQSIFIRFVYDSYMFTHDYGFVVDDISPMITFDSTRTIASQATDTSIVVDFPEHLEEPETRWYKARTRDTQGQFSAWSSLVATVLDTSGDSTSVISDQLGEQPFEFSVSEAYPNPFNPETSLRVTLPSSAQLNVTVFDILGREVYSKVYYNQQAGSMAVTLNGTSWASGYYFARVQMDGEQDHYSVLRKIVLLK